MASILKTISSKSLSYLVKHFRVVVIIWAVILILAGVLFFILPKWNNISQLGLADYQTELDRLHQREEYLKQITEMAEAFNQINQDQIDELSKILPHEEDLPGLFITMNQLVKESGFELSSISIAKEVTKAATAVAATTDEEGTTAAPAAVSSPDIKTLNIALQLRGSSDYSQFKKFLDNLEKNLRLADASTVSFSALGVTGGAATSGGFTVNLKTYYFGQ